MRHTVAFYTDSQGFGGAEQALWNLIVGVDWRYWRPVLLYHPNPGIAPFVEGVRGVGVELVALPAMPEGTTGARRVPGAIGALRALRPDVFHANLTWSMSCKYGLLAAMLAAVPVIIANHHLYVDQRWSRSRVAQQRFLALRVDRYVATSREVARQLHRQFRIPDRKLSVVHAGVAIERFAARPPDSDLRSYLTGGRSHPIVLTVARLEKQKGIEYLLEAATMVPEMVVIVAGDGPERSALQDRCRALHLDGRVRFLGHYDDIPALLACADLVVLPSLYEGLGLSLIEAMAAGRPVIGSAIGGIDEVIVDGETGLLVPPADPRALAGAIHRVLSDGSLAARFAAAGRERARREFSAEGMVCRLMQIYTELIAGRSNARAAQ